MEYRENRSVFYALSSPRLANNWGHISFDIFIFLYEARATKQLNSRKYIYIYIYIPVIDTAKLLVYNASRFPLFFILFDFENRWNRCFQITYKLIRFSFIYPLITIRLLSRLLNRRVYIYACRYARDTEKREMDFSCIRDRRKKRIKRGDN